MIEYSLSLKKIQSNLKTSTFGRSIEIMGDSSSLPGMVGYLKRNSVKSRNGHLVICLNKHNLSMVALIIASPSSNNDALIHITGVTLCRAFRISANRITPKIDEAGRIIVNGKIMGNISITSTNNYSRIFTSSIIGIELYTDDYPEESTSDYHTSDYQMRTHLFRHINYTSFNAEGFIASLMNHLEEVILVYELGDYKSILNEYSSSVHYSGEAIQW